MVAEAGAVAQEYRLVAFREQLVDRHVLADVGVWNELDPQLPEMFEVVGEDLFLHLEVRDAVEEDAAGLGPGIEERDLMPEVRQVFGDGEAGRPGADHCHPHSGRRRLLRHRPAFGLPLVVGNERLQLADRDRLHQLVRAGPDREAYDAIAFAELLLRAEAAAHLRQVARLSKDVRGTDDVAALQQLERTGNIVVDGAGCLAGGVGTLDAAGGLDLGRTQLEPEERLLPVGDAYLGILLVDRLALDLQPLMRFVRHSRTP